MMNKPLSSRDLENLSAYLDSQMTPSERSRLEAQLAVNPGLQTALDDLRQTRQLIRSLPKVKAPRNFTLKPSMLPARPPRPVFSLGALSFSAFSALAAILLLVFFIGDFMGYFTPSSLALNASESQNLSPEAVALATSMEEQTDRSTASAPAVMLAPQVENTGMGGGGGGVEDSGTPQADIVPDTAPSAKNISATAPMTGTDTVTTTLMLAPLSPTETPIVEAYAEPTVQYFPAETPAPDNQVVFTPLWVHLVEAALLLIVLGAGTLALVLLRRKA